MAVFIRAFLALILALMIVFVISKKGFTPLKRAIIGFLALLLIIAAVFYEISYSKQNIQDREILGAFEQNKTLKCKGSEITSSEFSYIGGTKVFARKDGKGIIVSIKDCEVK
ncbi:MAG: hypothetical protein LBP40_05390 [Campylobacteraceae bacterium]|jgi:hypothetical protein|nr:hypothetical protein [Campylobacteraceae bacterium]